MRRWLLLIIANLIAFFILMYFLDIFGYVKTYSNLREKLFTVEEGNNFPVEEELRMEMELAAEEDRKKMEQFLQEKEVQLKLLEEDLAAEKENLQQEMLSISKERENLLMREERIAAEEEEANNYDVKVGSLASRFYDMPPQLASERILSLEDDLLIIDVLAAMDGVAQGRGQQSIVPYLFSLMPPTDAARILKKSTISL